jgi:hypothetical protein
MMLNWPTFVLQRRINLPLAAVERVLCSPHLIRGGTELVLDSEAMCVRLESPFGVMFPPFGYDGASWCAPATVRTRRGRSRVRLEIEINPWDANSTEVVVRPQARRPYQWGGRRMREYFRVAHLTADLLTRFLSANATALAQAPGSDRLARSVV